VNESRPARPALATVICVYEVVLLLALPLIQWGLQRQFAATHPLRQYHAYPAHPLQSAVGWFGTALLIAAVVALWQMRRVAFLLFLAHFGLLLVLRYLRLPLMMKTYRLLYQAASTSGFYWPLIMLFVMIAVEWTINLLILWYVFRITSPKRLGQPNIDIESNA
jgi:hypothetical protein